MGRKPTDEHINFAQDHITSQFPVINGLQCTLLQTKKVAQTELAVKNKLQIVHSCGDHWIAASNIKCEPVINPLNAARI